MTPTVWGPIVWRMLFSCTRTVAPESEDARLRELLLELMPQVLPCHTCRLHALEHRAKVTRRAKGEPNTGDRAFLWLYYLKDEVNKSLLKVGSPRKRSSSRRSSIPLRELQARYLLHDGIVLNEVEVADVLVLMALVAKELRREHAFVRFCHLLGELAHLHPRSELRVRLLQWSLEEPVDSHALRIAEHVRVEHGLPVRNAWHYRLHGNT